MVFVGCDPGLTGALAVLDSETKEVSFVDTPVVEVRVGKKMKHQQDVYAMVRILRAICSGKDVMVVIEKVNAMPGAGAEGKRQSMGATSAFNFGMGYGEWLGISSCVRDSPPTGSSAYMEVGNDDRSREGKGCKQGQGYAAIP